MLGKRQCIWPFWAFSLVRFGKGGSEIIEVCCQWFWLGLGDLPYPLAVSVILTRWSLLSSSACHRGCIFGSILVMRLDDDIYFTTLWIHVITSLALRALIIFAFPLQCCAALWIETGYTPSIFPDCVGVCTFEEIPDFTGVPENTITLIMTASWQLRSPDTARGGWQWAHDENLSPCSEYGWWDYPLTASPANKRCFFVGHFSVRFLFPLSVYVLSHARFGFGRMSLVPQLEWWMQHALSTIPIWLCTFVITQEHPTRPLW